MPAAPLSVLLLGGTGTIGRATAAALCAAGHRVTALVRQSDVPGCEMRIGDVTAPGTVAGVLASGDFDAIVSCLASRTGVPEDAQSIDRDAHRHALSAAQAAGVRRFVLLSAICVQKPLLAFQRAKLEFEGELIASDLDWTIVRPTAYFKSLSGQVTRVREGKPFLVFGDGRLTACKPLSDADLARFLTHCLGDPGSHQKVLPVGGPGPAITPLDQVAMLERLTGQPVRVKRVPVAMMDAIVRSLALMARLVPSLAAKAELARIGRYYATESMLVWTGERYDAAATPETGSDRLEDHYAALLRGEAGDDRGAHRVF